MKNPTQFTFVQIRERKYNAEVLRPTKNDHPQMVGRLVGLYTLDEKRVWPKA